MVYPCLCLCFLILHNINTLPLRRTTWQFLHRFLTEERTIILRNLELGTLNFELLVRGSRFTVQSNYSLLTMRPLLSSYCVISIVTLSPGKIRIRYIRILPERYPKTSRPSKRLTRNVAEGNASVTTPTSLFAGIKEE